MSTTFSYGRGGRLYRYYVSGSLDPSRPSGPPLKRIPAGPLERLVLEVFTGLLERPVTFADPLPLIAGVELHERSVQIVLAPGALLEPHERTETALRRLQPLVEPHRIVVDDGGHRIIVDRKPVFRGGRATASGAAASENGDGIALLRTAHRLLDEHSMSPLDPETHAHARAPAWQRQRSDHGHRSAGFPSCRRQFCSAHFQAQSTRLSHSYRRLRGPISE